MALDEAHPLAFLFCDIYLIVSCILCLTSRLSTRNAAGFPASGHIRFDQVGKAVRYSYNVLHGNTNDRTLAKFSKDAQQKMKPCHNCEFFHDFKRFYEYYGRMDYAHRWVMSAFEATRIVFDSGVSDFTIYSLESRARTSLCLFTNKIIDSDWVFVLAC